MTNIHCDVQQTRRVHTHGRAHAVLLGLTTISTVHVSSTFIIEEETTPSGPSGALHTNAYSVVTTTCHIATQMSSIGFCTVLVLCVDVSGLSHGLRAVLVRQADFHLLLS